MRMKMVTTAAIGWSASAAEVVARINLVFTMTFIVTIIYPISYYNF